MKITKEQRSVLLKAAKPGGVPVPEVRKAFEDGSGVDNNLFRYTWTCGDDNVIVGFATLSTVGEYLHASILDQLALAKRLKEKK